MEATAYSLRDLQIDAAALRVKHAASRHYGHPSRFSHQPCIINTSATLSLI